MNEEEEINTKPYIVPKNVKVRFEIFDGFGIKELAYLLACALIGVCFGLIVWFISGSPLWMGLVVPFGAFGYFFGVPNPRTGRNSFDLLYDVRRFKRRQKRYYYKFGSGRGN